MTSTTSVPAMKAAICRQYGPPDVVEIADVPRPRLGAHDVLIKVRATAVVGHHPDCRPETRVLYKIPTQASDSKPKEEENASRFPHGSKPV